MKYDDAVWHSGGEFPKELQPDDAATHIGMFVAWALQHGFASDRHLKKDADAVGAVRERRMTGRQFVLAHCDAKFSDTDLNTPGNAFTDAYYEKGYMADWQAFAAARGFDSDYHAPDTWDTFDDLARILDLRFSEWQSGNLSYAPLPATLLRKRRWWHL